ncbi:NAD(P)H-binding protein [Desulfosarcina sp.]|uniref:NAD(P)H-binding protein n=1 Tax=Desulfosarcina sp. TaxID=2027861 RepID=UPI003569BA15
MKHPAMEKKTVLLMGATGLVGGHILNRLLENETYDRVIALTRSAITGAEAFSKLDTRIVDFGRPDQWLDQVAADQTICALGTTIKKAGSREAFRQVDYAYPLMIARAALNAGCRHFLLVSAMGADADSPVFYNRVKGDLEAAILGLGFTCVSIFRPSLLLGDRREFRPGEAVGQVLGRWLAFAIPKRYRPVHARTVAAAVVGIAAADASGNRVLASDAIAEWGAD